MKIIIRECKTDGKFWEYTHTDNDEINALYAAIATIFGESAFYHSAGIEGGSRRYGQIFKMLPDGSNTSVTGSISIDTEKTTSDMASALGSIKSEAKTAANRLNAKQPRPNAQGKPKPRKPKTE